MALAAPQYRDWEMGEFIQDNWHVKSWLTVNLGLRYDVYTPITEKHNALSNFDPTDPATLATGRIQVAGASGVSNSVNIATQYGDVQPRIGFSAYARPRYGAARRFRHQLLAEQRSLSGEPEKRADGGNLHDQPARDADDFKISDTLPAPVPNSVCLAAACGATTSSPGYTPSGFSVGAGTQLPYHNTTIYMINLTLEKEFAGNLLSVGFVSEPVRNLGRAVPNIATNLPPQGPGGCGATSTPDSWAAHACLSRARFRWWARSSCWRPTGCRITMRCRSSSSAATRLG